MSEKTIHMVDMPAKQIPALKYGIALDKGIKQIMMITHGGLGDQVCAEPALRYAFKLFKGYEICLLTSFPELFTHLPFRSIYSKDDTKFLIDHEWLVLHTNAPDGNVVRDFITHNYTQVVDFSTLCAFHRQIPIKDRTVKLVGCDVDYKEFDIVIHPGRHWKSKTFPKHWWNHMIEEIKDSFPGRRIAIIGKDVSPEIGTVDVVVPNGFMDLRNKLSLKELVTVLQTAKTVLTNDSAPLHIAASGDAHIYFIASCKEAEYLMHWRTGEFGWRMKNLEMDGLWNHQDSAPIRKESLTIEHMSDQLMEMLLPHPLTVVSWMKKGLYIC